MKILILLILIFLNLHSFQNIDSKTCKACHPTIYGEFYNSSHRKASIFEDPIHKAVWDLHPNKQKESYTCAKCHTPSDLELLKNLKENKKAMPIKSIRFGEQGINKQIFVGIRKDEHHINYLSDFIALAKETK